MTMYIDDSAASFEDAEAHLEAPPIEGDDSEGESVVEDILGALPELVRCHIYSYAALPSSGFEDHISTCNELHCEELGRFLGNLSKLRRVNKETDHLVRTCDVALLCVAITKVNSISKTEYPGYKGKILSTVSVDVHEKYVGEDTMKRLKTVLKDAKHVKRVSISGDVRLWDRVVVTGVLQGCMEVLAGPSYSALSVLILDVPVDVFDNVRGSVDVAFLMLRSLHADFVLGASVTWRKMEELHLVLDRDVGGQRGILNRLGEDVYEKLAKLVLQVHSATINVNNLLSCARASLSHLTLLYDGGSLMLDPLPELNALKELTCFVDTAEDLIEQGFPSLDVVNLRGMGPRIHGEARVPQLLSAQQMDRFVLHLRRSNFTPSMKTLRLVPFYVEDFRDFSWVLEELSIYAYWGVQSRDPKFCFKFVDTDNKRILARGFDFRIMRKEEQGEADVEIEM